MKKKKCKICGDLFPVFNSTQQVCSPKCALKYAKDKKKKKHDKIKKIQEPDRLRAKADRLFQEKYTKGKCESCNERTANCVHHYIFKSQSKFLRYHPLNAVPICAECHTRYHKSGDTEIMSKVIARRGLEWEQNLQELRRTPQKLTTAYLKEVIEELEC